MHVFLIAAITADGFIAASPTQISTSWTSKEDKRFFGERTKQAKVMLMGMTTYQTIQRPLPGRVTVVMTRTPQTVPAEFKDELVYTSDTPTKILTDLAARGFSEVAICGGSQIYTMFLKAGVIDTLYLTVEPVLFGQGVKLFTDAIAAKLKLKNCTHLNEQTLLLEYQVLK